MKKASQFGIFSVADSMQAAASALDVPLEVVKEMKKSGCVAFRGSRIHLRDLAEAILAAEEPSTILFPVPISAKCEPKVIEEFRDLVSMAVRCRWLSASEIFEILLGQIIDILGHRKLPPDVANKLTQPIHIGFGTAVMVLEPAAVDQFLGQSATLLEAFAEFISNRVLASCRESRLTKPKRAARSIL